MAEDVKIDITQLSEVSAQLDAIVTEFENASKNSEALEAAIGSPYGRNRLSSKAKEFEDRWSNKREKLKESLEGVQDHVQGVIDGFQEWDTEAAIALTPEQ